MWKFIKGVEPPPSKKKKLTPVEVKEKAKLYEKGQRTRKFLDIWLDGREWLKYDSESNVMSCVVCIKYATDSKATNSSFVKGSSNFKLEYIKDHEKSVSHERCVRVSAAQSQKSETEKTHKTPAEAALASLNKAQTDRLQKLFRSAHAIAKKGRPFTDFEWMCELDTKKGVEIGETYHNRKQARNFVQFIAADEREKVQDSMKGANFFSLMSDGSTDSSVIEEEIVYVRYAKQGHVFVQYVGLEEVGKANSENITKAVKSAATKGVGIPWEELVKKLVAIATDGASVMTGVNNGMVVRIKEDRTYILGIHCMAHRLELSYKDATKKHNLHQDISSLLAGLYNFYHYSPLNRSNLKEAFSSLDMKPLIPTRLSGTRWVSHHLRALDHFLRGYRGIVLHLEQIQSPDTTDVKKDQQAKAKNFFKVARTLTVVKYAMFMHDVLSHLSSLSTTMQKRTVSLAEVHSALERTTAVLTKYKTKPGPMLTKMGVNAIFQEVNLIGSDAGFSNACVNLLNALLASLQSRFDVSRETIHATRIVDFKFWPDRDNMTDFGDCAVATLMEHFKEVLESAGVKTEKIMDEWTTLKTSVYQPGWSESLKTLKWTELNRRHGEECSNILSLVDLLLSIPAATAEAERGFNAMKTIKTDWRSRLSNDSINDLMVILLLSPEIKDFDPHRAIKLWLKDGPRSRRPNLKEAKVDESDSSDEEEMLCVGVAQLANKVDLLEQMIMTEDTSDCESKADC